MPQTDSVATARHPFGDFAPDSLIDTPTAARLLSYSPATLNAWRNRKQGPSYIKVSGTSVRYRVCDLEEWVNSRIIGGAS
ncbi:MAG: helix-turn-helix transcriptional regulator [Candidatus Promineifilaceae bacterium]